MSITEALRLAMSSMWANKMRALLTLLGIIIGIAAVITISTTGNAMQKQTADSMMNMGATDLHVRLTPREDDMYAAPGADDPDSEFTQETVDRIKERFPREIAGVGIGGSSYLNGEVIADDGRYLPASISPVNPDQLWMSGMDITHGRSLTEEDIAAKRPVTVVTPDIVDSMLGGDPQEAVGSDISVSIDGSGMGGTVGDEMTLRVVGITDQANKPSGIMGAALSAPTHIFVPFTLRDEIDPQGQEAVSMLGVRVAPDVDQKMVREELQGFFDTLYKSDEEYHVVVDDFGDFLEEFSSVMGTISTAISVIAGISLLVGGIGVMNIMLVTVTERTREIGVRKALGARKRDIRLQFVVEAMIVCLIGGVIGVALGGGAGILVGKALIGELVAPPIGTVLIALVFSMGIGLFFGFYPANKAAKLDPIEALRYE